MLPATGPAFVDVARAAGLTHRTVYGGSDANTYILETTGTGVAFLDFDNDGILDLYVARYIDFDLATAPLPGARLPGVNCTYRGFPVMCGPRGLRGARDILYHNNGDGTFTDVTERAGIDKPGYRGLGVVWGDYDNDGHPDVVVANDAQPNLLYRNRGDGTFEEVGLRSGVAVDEDGRERAGMGVDFAD